MKSQTLQSIGKIEYHEDTPKPAPKDGEVLIRVRAAGICGSDIPRIYKNGAHRMPLIIGHEFAGEVCEVGLNVDEAHIGKRMGVFPLIPCRECTSCAKKQYEMCSNYSYLGSRTDGGFAEYVAVPTWNLIELPGRVTFEEAAMLEPMAVAVHAIRQLNIQPDMSAVVCGLGTIGQLVTMFLLQMGLRDVYVIGNKSLQKKIALSIGISEDNYCDGSGYEDISEWISAKTKGNGVDIYMECVGKNETLLQAIDNTAPAGQICIVGNPYSDMNIDRDVYWKILRRQITLHGTWNSSFTGEIDDDWHYVLSALENGDISPSKLITHRFLIEELKTGFEIMRDKSEDYIKIMMVSE